MKLNVWTAGYFTLHWTDMEINQMRSGYDWAFSECHRVDQVRLDQIRLGSVRTEVVHVVRAKSTLNMYGIH